MAVPGKGGMLAGASPRSEAPSIVSAQRPLLLHPPLPGSSPQACREEREKPCQSQEQSLGVQTLSQLGAGLQCEATEGSYISIPGVLQHPWRAPASPAPASRDATELPDFLAPRTGFWGGEAIPVHLGGGGQEHVPRPAIPLAVT